MVKFNANAPDLLSFNMDQPVKIFSKGAGRDRELWGVEVSLDCLCKTVKSLISVIC